MDDLKEFERKAGREPFQRRLTLDASGFCACPFHCGDSDKSAHLYQADSGVWRLKCFSSCNASWGPLDFVMKFDNLPTLQDAIQRLGGRATMKPKTEENGNGNAPTTADPPKPKAKPMPRAEYVTYGREPAQANVERFAKSRGNSGHTASLQTWLELGCRVKEKHIVNGKETDCICFPYFHPNGEFLYTLKLRSLDAKDFTAVHAAANDGFFNLDTINWLEPVFIVEGEPDVAAMEEAGYRAVSPLSASQPKFDKHALADIRKAPEIYIVGDQPIPKRGHDDDPGAVLMDRLEKELKDMPHKVFRIRFAADGIEKEKKLKDVSALRAYYGAAGFERRIEELKVKAKEWTWINDKIPQVSSISVEPQKWTVDRMFPYGGLAILCGKQGTVKSLFSLFLSKYLTAPVPKDFLGRKIEGRAVNAVQIGADGALTPLHDAPVAPVPVLYLDRENPKATVGERRGKIGILGRDNFRYWGDWMPQEDLEAGPTETFYPPEPDDPRILKWAMRERGFIIFDSLQQWYGDYNENSNTDMAKLMNKFKHLSRLCAGVLILHHTPKESFDGPTAQWRGATAIVAIPEMAISIEKSEDDVYKLRPIRFRCCANWELDFRMIFNPTDIRMGVMSDRTSKEALKEAVAKKETVAAEKKSTKQAEQETLDSLIEADRNRTKASLSAESTFSDKKVDRLLAGRWMFKATRNPKWERIENPGAENTLY